MLLPSIACNDISHTVPHVSPHTSQQIHTPVGLQAHSVSGAAIVSAHNSSRSSVTKKKKNNSSCNLREFNLYIYYQNMNSIRGANRTEAVYMSALEMDFDVYVFCETNLNSSISNRMIFPETFNIYRCDRSSANSDKESGGGTLVAVNRRFPSSIFQESICNEEISVKILVENVHVILCCIYLPPGSNFQKYLSHTASVRKLVESESTESKIYVIGDFNLPNTFWRYENEEDISLLPYNVRLSEEEVLVDNFAACGLSQACGIPNQNNRFLDLVFTNDEENCQIAVSDPLIQHETHHYAMSIVIDCNVQRCNFIRAQGDPKTILNLYQADFAAISNEMLLINWNIAFTSVESFDAVTMKPTADAMFEYLHQFGVFDCVDKNVLRVETALDFNVIAFYVKVYDILARHSMPISKRKLANNYPAWFDGETISLLKTKKRLFNKFKKSRLASDELAYNQIRDSFKARNRALHRLYLNKLQRDIKINPKSFWRHVNAKRQDKGLPVNVSYNTKKADNPTEAAGLFSDYFKSVFDNIPACEPPEFSPSASAISPFELSVPDVRNAIIALDISKSIGPDEIPNSLLKQCVEGFSNPLHILFNESLSIGSFPSVWKISHIVPIHKKGSKIPVENYRGISILSAIPKMFECIVHNHLYRWVEPQISNCQHGFLKKRSTVTNLAEFISRTTQWMMKGSQVDTVYTDMSKAFDVVNIDAMLAVMPKYGINGLTLNWLRDYLKERVQYVKIEQTKSTSFKVQSGVPQGSHLGPLLFVMVMNELPDLLPGVYILIYADDVKIFLPVESLKDCHLLQHSIQRFLTFCKMFGLQVNATKCSIVSFSRRNVKLIHDYSMNGCAISRKESVCDLGVELDSELNFNRHIEKMVAKSNSLFGFIKRISRDLDDPHAIISIYNAFVRSVIEYASVTWQPFYDVHKKRIERIQKKVLRFALRNLGWRGEMPDYKSLCLLVGTETLENRRLTADALFLKDILTGKLYSPYLLNQVTRYSGRSSLRTVRPFQLRNRVQNYARNEPMYRIMSFYNENLPFINVDMTKNQIRDKLRLRFLM